MMRRTLTELAVVALVLAACGAGQPAKPPTILGTQARRRPRSPPRL